MNMLANVSSCVHFPVMLVLEDKLASRPKFCQQNFVNFVELGLEHLSSACPWTFILSSCIWV